MRAEFFTKGFEKTESVDEFLQKEGWALVDHFMQNERDIHLRVTVDEDSHRVQNRKPHFICEITIKSAASKKYFKTHRASHDFRTAVYEAAHAMKRMLVKKLDRRRGMKFSARHFTPEIAA
jgi:ribosome-associated translation inhibitor RaiA